MDQKLRDRSAELPQVSWETCGDELMAPGWEQGFSCVQPPGHEGPHRDETWTQEALSGVDTRGRRYRYAMEWGYL